MKLTLNKNKLKTLSKDRNVLPAEATMQIGGGTVWTREGGCVEPFTTECTDTCQGSRGATCATSNMC
ncbi:hypothetical protein SG34_017000 [Thalassomonas viridans]|uniref:Uncharacterized protein n=1 Tax=Thalassomonas viridans TaxID=137584 RepID=A0AAE9YY71_9GAMM|nr:hypothetical protein [Thalassomonas viridans]WDE03108.1 hypothetical protein SG34_017000 [Thalassomonas viridans]